MDKIVDFKMVGLRIRRARKAKDYTQEYVSEICGITSKQISQIETGNSGFTISTLTHLCNLLEVSSDYILFGNSVEHFKDPILGSVSNLNNEQKEILDEIVRLFVKSCNNKDA